MSVPLKIDNCSIALEKCSWFVCRKNWNTGGQRDVSYKGAEFTTHVDKVQY